MGNIKLVVVGFFAVICTVVFASGYSGGSGIASDPYLISNKADLLELGETTADYAKCFKMTANIDLEGVGFSTAVIAGTTKQGSFKRIYIKYDGTKFTGVFDGNGHKILNLHIFDGEHALYTGLFGCIGKGGVVKNLKLVDCEINALSKSGGICSRNEGSILNCSASVEINAYHIIGGLCAINDGVISNCYTTGYILADGFVDMTGGDSRAVSGGVCGSNGGIYSLVIQRLIL